MKKLYLIAYDEKLDREALKVFLEKSPDVSQWFYSIPQSIFAYSSLSAQELYGRIVEAFPTHGRLFVTSVQYHDAQGWLPNNHWEIIKKNVAVHDYTLDFQGYWLDRNKSGLPAESGIYCVYAASYNPAQDTVSLQKLLYIGKAVNVRTRHADHEGLPSWERKLCAGQILCYSFAPLAKRSLMICEAALIYKNKPICNDIGKDSFLHEGTHVVTRGRNALLETEFTVLHS